MKIEFAWGSAISGMVAIDYYVSKHYQDATLSSAARKTFRVDTTKGRVFFIGGWVVLSAWLIPHIIQPAIEALADDSDVTAERT